MNAIKRMTPPEAHEVLRQQPSAVLIDVRTNMEYLFVGHPIGAVHIPWQEEPDWRINHNFVQDVTKALIARVNSDKDDIYSLPLLLICRSGKRSFDAGLTLINAGFQDVSNVEQGFEGDLNDDNHRSSRNGWRFHDLPWEQC